uniref:AA9 family lytic polysaccharide monooxygenase D n=1 Tax=Malbranchea cinnamomea TaxID=5041 RepID=LP9D_MALCI|nr:LPMO9D [Malbranchea cinnamomea]
MRIEKLLNAALLAGAVSAHTIMTSLVVDGTEYPPGHAVRIPSYNGPITDVTSNSVACNGPPNPTTPSSEIIMVRAGSTIQGKWRHTETDVIDPSHKGPVMAYLKKVDDAINDPGTGDGWFKIWEDGLHDDGTWAVDDLIAANGYQDIPIPPCLADGQYLLRAEIIALHGASQPGGAQLYMECAQIGVVGGSGTANPSTVAFPGAYKADDPGITVNIYWPPLEEYIIPGPDPFTC